MRIAPSWWCGAGLLCALLAAAPAEVGAQGESAAIVRGERVRVTINRTPDRFNRERFTGSLIRLDRDTLVVSRGTGGADLAVPTESVRSLEVVRGRKSSAGKGALIGLAAGAVAGVTVGLVGTSDEGLKHGGLGDLTGMIVAVIGAGGALFGTGVGALVGGRFKTDRWERVPMESLRVGLYPCDEGGARLRVSLAFN